MHVCYAPHRYSHLPRPWVFLAGSIEQGTADPWQECVIDALSPYSGTLLNPRRPHWDSTWEQSTSNPHFVEQVTWELQGLEKANAIAMYFDPKTMSPVTLLELGLFAKTDKMIVACPDGFWRKGNVEIVCAMHDIDVLPSLDALIETLERGMQARGRVRDLLSE